MCSPFFAKFFLDGGAAIAHNGNITNGIALAPRKLVRARSIFRPQQRIMPNVSSTCGALASTETSPSRMEDALPARVEGAFYRPPGPSMDGDPS